ncbi:MAG TPA: hypothetical protein DDZ42_10080 [Candidatus Rokubacteria bacterium]|nr:hypothetical protein [Candidatus Rokubacteria bacterium]
MSDVRLVIEPHASGAAQQFVRDHLDAHNIAATGRAEYSSLSIFLRGAHDEIRGGLLGAIWGEWLHVAILWVAEPLRGRGHGRALLAAAESHASERGCHDAFLETFSFQAPAFYQKLGWQVFGTPTTSSASASAGRRADSARATGPDGLRARGKSSSSVFPRCLSLLSTREFPGTCGPRGKRSAGGSLRRLACPVLWGGA